MRSGSIPGRSLRALVFSTAAASFERRVQDAVAVSRQLETGRDLSPGE
jgi:hypothetical protein